jgi:hypothetical protein
MRQSESQRTKLLVPYPFLQVERALARRRKAIPVEALQLFYFARPATPFEGKPSVIVPL